MAWRSTALASQPGPQKGSDSHLGFSALKPLACDLWFMTKLLSMLPMVQLIGSCNSRSVSRARPAALQVAILAAAAPEWEVRNAAHLAFAAVAIRILGYRNVTAVRDWI